MSDIVLDKSNLSDGGISISSSNLSAKEPVSITSSSVFMNEPVSLSGSLSILNDVNVDGSGLTVNDTVPISESSIESEEETPLGDPDTKYFRKDKDDYSPYSGTFEKGVKVGSDGYVASTDFQDGYYGFKIGKKRNGTTFFEADYIILRKMFLVTYDNFDELFNQHVDKHGIATLSAANENAQAWVKAYATDKFATIESVAQFKKDLYDDNGYLKASIISKASITQYADENYASIESLASFKKQLFGEGQYLLSDIISESSILQYADEKGAATSIINDFKRLNYNLDGTLKDSVISKSSILQYADEKGASTKIINDFRKELYDDNGKLNSKVISSASVLQYADEKGAATKIMNVFKKDKFNDDGTLKDSAFSESMLQQIANGDAASTTLTSIFGEGQDKNNKIAEITLLANKDYSSIKLNADQISLEGSTTFSLPSSKVSGLGELATKDSIGISSVDGLKKKLDDLSDGLGTKIGSSYLSENGYINNIINALNSQASVAGGFIKAEMIDVDNMYIKHLYCSDDILNHKIEMDDGYIVSKWKRSDGKWVGLCKVGGSETYGGIYISNCSETSLMLMDCGHLFFQSGKNEVYLGRHRVLDRIEFHLVNLRDRSCVITDTKDKYYEEGVVYRDADGYLRIT